MSMLHRRLSFHFHLSLFPSHYHYRRMTTTLSNRKVPLRKQHHYTRSALRRPLRPTYLRCTTADILRSRILTTHLKGDLSICNRSAIYTVPYKCSLGRPPLRQSHRRRSRIQLPLHLQVSCPIEYTPQHNTPTFDHVILCHTRTRENRV